MIPLIFRRITFSGAVLLLAACGREERVEVTQFRAPFKDDKEPVTGLTATQRYSGNPATDILSWTTPEGWNYLSSTEFRHINFSFGPKGEGECYLTLLQASGGNPVLDNLNRWLKQMDQPPLTEDGLAALPQKSVFGRQVPAIDVKGTFTGGSGPAMAPSAPLPGYRMIGAILEAPQQLFTIKMTGPEALVAEHAEKFDAFCKSLAPAAVMPPNDDF